MFKSKEPEASTEQALPALPPELIVLYKATTSDFDAICDIWKQEHVLPFLAFEKTTHEEDFKQIFNTSEVYVLKEDQKIVAVRRIVTKQGKYQHTVEFGSFAVHQDCLGRNLGRLFYKLFMEEVRKRPMIKRIEMGITTDNDPAFQLAKKMGFTPTVEFADRPRRETGPEEYRNKWRMGARYMEYILDENILESSISSVQPFLPVMPKLKSDVCSKSNHLNISGTHGTLRFSHIIFWSINLDSGYDDSAIAHLRHQLIQSSKQCKKIELYTHDQDTLNLLKSMGAHCYGNKKRASCLVNDQYYDEVAVEFSFFNIDDAKEIVNIYIDDRHQAIPILWALIRFQKTIDQIFDENQIDEYGKVYLENLAFQMIRESVGENAIHRYREGGKAPQPWSGLIDKLVCYPDVKSSLSNLHSLLHEAPLLPCIKLRTFKNN